MRHSSSRRCVSLRSLVGLAGGMLLGITTAAKAQYVLGSFQGASDPTDAGWIDSNNSNPITSDPNSTFPTGVVPGYPQSLEMLPSASGFGDPTLELQFSPAEAAAFNANSYLTFTMSAPTSTAGGAATSGYFQDYNLAFNSPTALGGTGYYNMMNGGSAAATWGTYSQAQGSTSNNQNGEPNFYFYAGAPSLFSETVTIDYAATPNFAELMAADTGPGSYLQMSFQFNQGGFPAGVAPLPLYMNNVVLSTQPFGVVPEPASLGLLGIAGLGLLRRRRQA